MGADFAVPGQIVMTCGVADVSPAAKAIIKQRVQGFDVFTEDQGPYSDHGFGRSDSRWLESAITSSGRSISTTPTTAWAVMTRATPRLPAASSPSCTPSNTDRRAAAGAGRMRASARSKSVPAEPTKPTFHPIEKDDFHDKLIPTN